MISISSVHIMGEADIEKFWSDIEECLKAEPGLWCEVFTIEGIKRSALRGHMQVWCVVKEEVLTICFMTQVYRNEVQKVLNVWWMYGEGLPEALPGLDSLLDRYAGKLGCSLIQVQGRLGLKRFLEPLGAKFLCATFARRVRSIVEN